MKEGAVQIARKHIPALLMVACLLVALAFGGMAAWADTDSGLNGENTLTVKLATGAYNETDSQATPDIAEADVTYDIYKIASATKDSSYDTYNYTWDIEEFAALKPGSDAEMDAYAWQVMADNGVTLIDTATDAPDAVKKNMQAGETLTGLTDGLYLVVPHNAHSVSYDYSFLPTIVSLPTKNPKGTVEVPYGGYDIEYPEVGTAFEYGPWITDATINLKYERQLMYGRLIINKTVDKFEGKEPAVFVFHVTSADDSPFAYDNYAIVSVDASGVKNAELTHIPAGTKLKVQEVNSGSDYKADNTEAVSCDPILADKYVENAAYVSVSFSNTFIGDNPGSGIENKFTTDGKDKWTWTSSPSGADAKAEGGDAK